MLFSIIIPIYNTGSYLDECIGSVIRQDYHDFELILIDDGSTDSSAEICRRWKEKDSRIMLITKENQGTARTRNVGLNCVTFQKQKEIRFLPRIFHSLPIIRQIKTETVSILCEKTIFGFPVHGTK